jgi:hypothetical protein
MGSIKSVENMVASRKVEEVHYFNFQKIISSPESHNIAIGTARAL